MTQTRVRLIATALTVAIGASVTTPAAQVFRTTTEMVLLSVSAARGAGVAGGLRQSDFTVLEDGRPQEISVFAADPQPIALSLLIDASMSMETKIGLAGEAAVGFVRRMRPGDSAQVVTFNTHTNINQTFTGDAVQLERAIRSIRVSGSTSLYTAMYIAFSELERLARQSQNEVRRQAIVLLSDGEDTASSLDYDAVLERARRSGVILFAVGLRDSASAMQGFRQHDYSLRSLAQTTGGRVFFVDSATELPAIYNQIADELASQYTIGYVSRNTSRDGGWRQIAVRINQPGVVARTRAGYFGPTK